MLNIFFCIGIYLHFNFSEWATIYWCLMRFCESLVQLSLNLLYMQHIICWNQFPSGSDATIYLQHNIWLYDSSLSICVWNVKVTSLTMKNLIQLYILTTFSELVYSILKQFFNLVYQCYIKCKDERMNCLKVNIVRIANYLWKCKIYSLIKIYRKFCQNCYWTIEWSR